jgi:hypothetical protein
MGGKVMKGRVLAGVTALLLAGGCNGNQGNNNAAGGNDVTAGNEVSSGVGGNATGGNNSAEPGAANPQYVGHWRYANGACGDPQAFEFMADGRVFQGGRLGGTWRAEGNTIWIATQMWGEWESHLSGDTITLGGHGGAAGGSLVRCPR